VTGVQTCALPILINKLSRARELLRAVYKRQSTLRKVVDQVVVFQQEALKQGLECLKPLTFKDVSRKIDMHETTVCRVVMNKYVQTHYGVVPLKDFFPSRIRGGSPETGDPVSSEQIKGLIVECIEEEDKRRPVSDLDIVKIIFARQKLKVARRTVAKYREELRILSSSFRREK
jgi:RNA polymerase sigma-54 factor